MVPILVLVVSFSVLVVLGRVGVTALRDWLTCLRWALALMFVVTASAHWGSRRADLVQMVPASFSDPELWVTLTGIAELAGAVGLVVPRLAPLAATGLVVLLIAVFPANVHAARAGLTLDGRAVMGVAPRAALQLIFLGAVLTAGFAPWLRARANRARAGAR